MAKVSSRSVRKPGSTRRRLNRLRANRPAPTSSNRDRASCTTTRMRRKRAPPPAEARAADCWRRVEATSARLACSAGASPNSRPVKVESASVKTSSRTSKVAAIHPPVASAGRMRSSALVVHTETSRPSRPPASAMTRLSVRSCRSRERRAAPRASRMAISRRREAARASSRLATLAQAISSTSPTRAISATSGFSHSCRNWLMPCAAGCNSSFWPTMSCSARLLRSWYSATWASISGR